MGLLLEFLMEVTGLFLGFMVLFMLLVLVVVLLGTLGVMVIFGLMMPYVLFVGAGEDFKPERLLLVLGALVGLSLVHWYYPLIFLGVVLVVDVVFIVGSEVATRCVPSPETVARKVQAARLERRRAKAALRNSTN
jgi:hypothetical protein